MNIIIDSEVKSILKSMGKKTITIYKEIPSGC